MSERTFVHGGAYTDVKTNFLYHEEVVKLIPKIINSQGILNIGGKTQTVYSFAKLSKINVKKIKAKQILKKKYCKNQIVNTSKLDNFLKN